MEMRFVPGLFCGTRECFFARVYIFVHFLNSYLGLALGDAELPKPNTHSSREKNRNVKKEKRKKIKKGSAVCALLLHS